jgi:hypothetical protein
VKGIVNFGVVIIQKINAMMTKTKTQRTKRGKAMRKGNWDLFEWALGGFIFGFVYFWIFGFFLTRKRSPILCWYFLGGNLMLLTIN